MDNNLSSDNIITINNEIIKKFGGEASSNVNKGNLEFIITKISNIEDVYRGASVLFHELLKARPFADGNRGTTFEAVRVLLEMNNKKLKYNNVDDVIAFMNDIGDGKVGLGDIENWLKGK